MLQKEKRDDETQRRATLDERFDVKIYIFLYINDPYRIGRCFMELVSHSCTAYSCALLGGARKHHVVTSVKMMIKIGKEERFKEMEKKLL